MVTIRSLGWSLLLVFISVSIIGCAESRAKPVHTQVFKTSALTTNLQRGVSTMADVKKALGEPQGSGGFLFPMGIGNGPIWYYESIKVDASGGKIDLQQDVVLVFFKGDRFEGFLWFSDASKEMMRR